MWWIVAILFIAFAFLTPKPNLENARAAQLGDFQFPRAKEGDPVPMFWGTVRLKAPNTLWYGDFHSSEITKKVKTGLFSSKNQVVGHRYYIGMNLGLALGPNVTLKRIWAGKYTVWTGSVSTDTDIDINLPNLFGGDELRGGLMGRISFYNGSFTQNRDPYLAEKCDANVPRYGGVSHLVFKGVPFDFFGTLVTWIPFYIGTTTNLEPFNFELSRVSDVLGSGYGIMPNGLDVNPMEILFDALTGKWGRLGVDSTLIDTTSWHAASATLYAEGNGMSLKLESPNSGKTVAEEVLRQADGLLYQDPQTGKIVAKLIREDYNILTLQTLDVSIIKDVTNFAKTTWDNTFNQCRVTFTNRDKDYADAVASAQDFANINFQQRIRSTDLSFPGIAVPELGSKVASRALGIYSVPLYKCTLKCTRAASSLRPGDVFLMNWQPFNLVGMVMRVQRIDLGELASGVVTINCIQDKFAANTMVFAPPESSGWQAIDTSPLPIATRNVFEAPYFILQAAGAAIADNESTCYIVGKKPSQYSQSFDAESSSDNFVNTYSSLDNARYAGSARLAANYAATEGGAIYYDTTTGITIDNIEDISVLQSFIARNDSNNGAALIVIGSEILSYRTFVNNLNGTYTLQGISRGFLDTPPQAHITGDYVFFIAGQDGLSESIYGDTETVKVRLRDNTVSGTLAEASALVDTLIFNRRPFRPAAPAYLTLNGSRTPAPVSGAVTVAAAWRERTRKAAALVWYDDPTQTPEAGTTYTLRHKIDAGAWTTVTGLAVASYSVPVTGLVGVLTVEVWAVRDNFASLVTETLTITLS